MSSRTVYSSNGLGQIASGAPSYVPTFIPFYLTFIEVDCRKVSTAVHWTRFHSAKHILPVRRNQLSKNASPNVDARQTNTVCVNLPTVAE